MNNQTIQNNPADRSDEAKSELDAQLRLLWQGWQFQDRTLKDEGYRQSIYKMRELLDEDKL